MIGENQAAEKFCTDKELKLIFGSMPGNYLVIMPDIPRFTIVAVTDGYLEVTQTKRNEIIGKALFDVFPDNPNDTTNAVDAMIASLKQVIKHNKKDVMGIRKHDIQPDLEHDFKQKYWNAINYPILDDDQQVKYILHTVTDVTNCMLPTDEESKQLSLNKALRKEINRRNQVEKALRESREEYKNLYKKMSSGFAIAEMIYDDEGKPFDFRWIEVNPSFEKSIGFTRDILLKNTARTLFPKVNPNLVKNFGKVMLTGKQLHFENYNFELNKWSDVIAYKITPKHFAYFTFDITEHKKAEELNQKILENERQLTEELQTTNEELKSTYELMALDTDHSLNMIHPDDIVDMQTAIKRLEQKGKIEIEYRQRTKKGEYRWISNKMNLIRDDVGKPLYRDGNIRDITMRKRIEEEMETTMDELKRSNEELERFAYVSSHDLQEPIRMVKLYSQLLERRYKDNLDSDANDFIEYIVEGANRMKQLIDNLLEYSRINSQAKEFENVDLEKVLDNVLSNLSISITEFNVTIFHDPLPTIFADQNQMLQVFQNLISNAIKFHGPNPPKINISSQKTEKKWILSVADNGIGIDPKHQKQIFEIFKRLHTRAEYPGTGIGLSTTQKIITHHGGRIWVESEPGKGSTFYFTIPSADGCC